jgi:polyisoprenoid-binding protein YceI
MRSLYLAGTGALLLAAGAALAPMSPASAASASYTADTGHSRLEFVGVQAGAEFTGVFEKFTANVDFAPDALAGSRIDVQIDMNSVNSKDKDRDTTIRGKDVFDVAHNPTAHYVTKSITKTAAGYSALGALSLRGVTKDVPIAFQFSPGAAGAKLSGSAKLNRLDFGVGQGDWKSTETVGDAVKINFSLVLKPKG